MYGRLDEGQTLTVTVMKKRTETKRAQNVLVGLRLRPETAGYPTRWTESLVLQSVNNLALIRIKTDASPVDLDRNSLRSCAANSLQW